MQTRRGAPLSRQAMWAVVGMIALGTVVRVVLAFTTYGARIDVGAYRVFYEGVREHGLSVYSAINNEPGFLRIQWPYAPGYLPWIAVAHKLDLHGVLSFHTAIKLPAIAADAALAWVAQAALGVQQRPARDRLLACGVIALGPIFVFISGFHGQIDAVAVLPAVLAVYGWHRWPDRWRPLACGLLIGVAAAIKPIPILAVIPLVTVAPRWRDRVTLVVASVGVPALLLAPFAAADLDGVLGLRHYSGFPGLGGLSLAAQPTLALRRVPISATEQFVMAHGGLFAVVVTAAVAVLLWRKRPSVWEGEYVIFLVFFVADPFYARSYLVWLLPFVVLTGRIRLAAAMQALGFAAAMLGFVSPSTAVLYLYLSLLMALLAVAVVAAALAVWRLWSQDSQAARPLYV